MAFIQSVSREMNAGRAKETAARARLDAERNQVNINSTSSVAGAAWR